MPISTADEGGETWKLRRREGRGVKGSRDELARRDGKSDIVSIDVAGYECMRGSCRKCNFRNSQNGSGILVAWVIRPSTMIHRSAPISVDCTYT